MCQLSIRDRWYCGNMKLPSEVYCLSLWTFLIVYVFTVEAPKYGEIDMAEETDDIIKLVDPIKSEESEHEEEIHSNQVSSNKARNINFSEMNTEETNDSWDRSQDWVRIFDIYVNLSLLSNNSCQQINHSVYSTEENRITIFSRTFFEQHHAENILNIQNSTYATAILGAGYLDAIISEAKEFDGVQEETSKSNILTLYFLREAGETSRRDEKYEDYVIFRCNFAINRTTVITKVLPKEVILWRTRKPNNVTLTFRFFGPYDSGEFNLLSIVEDFDKFVKPSYCSSKIPFFYSLVISGELKKNSLFILFVSLNYTLSTVSLLLIFLTAKLSLQWRHRRSNIILVNFTVAIFSQIILHFVSDFSEVDEGLCSTVTILCHYFTLVQFFWTSTIAYMQYRRYVQVFDENDGYFLIKLILFAWVTPVLIVSASLVIVFSIPNKSKTCDDKFKICSLINTYLLKYTVSIPLLLTLLVNFVFFILIFRHLLRRKVEFDQKSNALLEVKLAFVLFFLLDINLIVAIIADMFSIDILALIFVTSHSLQGVLLFVVFVIRNKYSRQMYVRWIKVAYDKLTIAIRC